MNKLLLFCVILLTGCTTAPVAYKFPEAPKELMESCGKLDTIDTPTVLLSDLMKTVAKNYSKFHECSGLVQNWQEWYTKQKKISDEANQ